MVIEGDDVTLTCNATGSPPPKISWHKKSDYLIGHGDQLTLRNVTRYDGDIYECVAGNGVGKVAKSWTKLTVECE
jgi:Immunoglobulin domain